MIRLAWRQFRTPAIVAGGLLLLLTVFAAVTGPNLAHAYAVAMAGCRPTGDCTAASSSFAQTDSIVRTTLGTLVAVVPALIGAFWGAPLIASETESGTFPLVWTQSVTRTRWLVVKLAVVGLSSVLAAGLLSLIVTWWSDPLDEAAATAYATFGERDIAPVGYAALAFMIGVTAGMLIRRTVPAMFVTLFTFVVVRIGISYGVRPRIISPIHLAKALDPVSTGFGSEASPSIMLNSLFNGGPTSDLDPMSPTIPNSWIYSTRVVDSGGHDLTNQILDATCPGRNAGAGPAPAGHIHASDAVQAQSRACVTKIAQTYHELVTYQPAGRYWTLQWSELAIYSVAALLLGAFCIWCIRHRAVQ
jgi:ABC-type transport system involved in multi-copper enzyme maturation permease subunit